MQSKLVLAATAAAAGALAIDLSGTFPRAFRRAAELDARDEAECLSAYSANSAVVDDFPVLPTALATLTDVDVVVPTVTDPCVFPSITGPAGAVITSYSSALQSWQDAHVTELRSLFHACSDVPQFSSVLALYGDVLCSTAAAVITSADADGDGDATATAGVTTATPTATATETEDATATASGDATGDASGSGGAASTTASTAAAAPKETGLFVAAAAAAAVAGVAGVVML